MPGTTTPIFSTPIYLDENAGGADLNRRLQARIGTMAASDTSDDAFRAHQGGYYSAGTFFESKTPEVEEVVRLVRTGLDRYLDDLGVAATVSRTRLQGWVAHTRASDYQTPHLHAGSTVSGVYYVTVPERPEPEGCIDFITPLDAQECTFLKGRARSHCRVIPKPGSLLIFPSYLRHYTHPFQGEGTRICVVFNALIEQNRAPQTRQAARQESPI